MDVVKDIEQRVLNTLGMSKSRSPKLDTPVRIDIYTESSPRSPRQLLERWSISVVRSGDSGRVMLDSLQAGYKKLVILLRAVYTQTRQLPLWSRRRGALAGTSLHYEISVAESVTSFDEHMSEFQFGSQETPLGTLYLSVWYRKFSAGGPSIQNPSPPEETVLGSDLINSEYFRDQSSLALERKSSAPIPIASETRNAPEVRASSLPVQGLHMHRAQPVPIQDVGSIDDPGMDMTPPDVDSFHPQSLPARFGGDAFNCDDILSGIPFNKPPSGSRSRGSSVDQSIVSPVLSMSGVAQPMDIPVGKMRRTNSRSSLGGTDEPSLGSSRGTSPSSFGSSFGSSPHNVFAFTPPFASAMSGATPVAQSLSPIENNTADPLVFGEARGGSNAAAGSYSSRTIPVSSFKTFQEASLEAPEGGAGSSTAVVNTHPLTVNQSRPFPDCDDPYASGFGQFSAEDLPFADPSGPEDHDSKIGSFVEELWNAPALAMFSTGGQRVTQSTKALHEELAKLRETKEKLVECNRENRVSACID